MVAFDVSGAIDSVSLLESKLSELNRNPLKQFTTSHNIIEQKTNCNLYNIGDFIKPYIL